jgi:sigma-B regulation protein RsbU (phosphoserine phosphatase)
MFLSSLEDVNDKAHGFEVGGNDYLTKPFEILEVKARVRSLLKAKAYAAAVKEAAERDLRIAREIQTGLLPADLADLTRGTGLDVHALLEPAQLVGGDLYTVQRLGADRVLVAVGDVSGKGISAALFMAVAMTLLRNMARHGKPLEEILREVNDELFDQNPRGMFVTLQCLIIDIARRTVTCANAGHNPAIHLGPGKRPQQVLTSTGRMLGLLPADEITTQTIAITPGDTLVLFTDGVNEAHSPDGDLFGDDRLLAHLASSPGATARETARGVLSAVRAYANGAKQSDDITVMAVRFDPSA